MNLVLLAPSDRRDDGRFVLRDRRARHVVEVLRVAAGDEITVGLQGERIGRASIVSSAPDEVVLDATFDAEPPARSPVDLLLAMPRPKILRKVLQTAASMGVSRIALVNGARVEKSYFDSPLLHPDELAAELHLGLEQARDTVPPVVTVHPRFRPFVEDELAGVWGDDVERLLAHPHADALSTEAPQRRVVVAIGPEGGWVPFEVDLLVKHGFRAFSLGQRILRVDVAVPAIIGRLEERARPARERRL